MLTRQAMMGLVVSLAAALPVKGALLSDTFENGLDLWGGTGATVVARSETDHAARLVPGANLARALPYAEMFPPLTLTVEERHLTQTDENGQAMQIMMPGGLTIAPTYRFPWGQSVHVWKGYEWFTAFWVDTGRFNLVETWNTWRLVENGSAAAVYLNGEKVWEDANFNPDYDWDQVVLYYKSGQPGGDYAEFDNVALTCESVVGYDNGTLPGGLAFADGSAGTAALYHFDGTLNSAIGGPAFQGTPGTINYVTGPGGSLGTCAEFPASNPAVRYATDGSLPATQDLQVDVWVKPYVSCFPSVPEVVPVCKNGAYMIAIDRTTRHVVGRLGHGVAGSWDVSVISTKVLGNYDDRWYRISLRYDGTDVLLYINGELAGKANWLGVIQGGGDLTVGSFDSASGPTFAGCLDELRVRSRPTLPWPLNGSKNIVRTGPVLRWPAAPYATSYNIYCGTSSTSPAYQGSVTTTSYTLGTLTSNTTYYWRIDPIVTGGVVLKGDVWNFRAVTTPLGLTVDGGVLKRNGIPFHNIGVNLYDVFNFSLAGNGSYLYDNVTSLLTDTLATLHNGYNIKYLRMMADAELDRNSLYWTDKAEFFRRLDNATRAVGANGLGTIPSFFWNIHALPTYFGEPTTAWADNASKTRMFMRVYIRDMLTRYHDNATCWGWECGCEWPQCVNNDNNTFVPAFAAFGEEVRKYDPYRFLSSGLGDIRWPGEMVSWNPDPINTFGGHWYHLDMPWADTVRGAMDTAIACGKPLFMGEFGGTQSDLSTWPAAFANVMVPTLVNEGVPLAAPWIFEPFGTALPDYLNLECIKAANDSWDAGYFLRDDFESNLFESDELSISKWSRGGWWRDTDKPFSGYHSVKCGLSSSSLTSNVRMDARGYQRITVDFRYQHSALSTNHNVYVQLYNGTSWVTRFTISNSTANGTWLDSSFTIYNSGGDAAFFNSGFRIRFAGSSLGYGEYVWIDDVHVSVGATVQGTVALNGLVGDITTVPVTITVRSDPAERHVVYLNSADQYSFATFQRGIYDVTAQAPGWIIQRQSGIDLTGTGATVNFSLAAQQWVTVLGTVRVGGYVGDNTTVAVRIVLHPTEEGEDLVRQVFLAADGTFSLTDIPMGTYDVFVKGYASLQAELAGVSIMGNPTVLPLIVLTGDDANNDNRVSFEDFALLQNSYGQRGVAGADPLAAAAEMGGVSGICGLPGIVLLVMAGLTSLFMGGDIFRLRDNGV